MFTGFLDQHKRHIISDLVAFAVAVAMVISQIFSFIIHIEEGIEAKTIPSKDLSIHTGDSDSHLDLLCCDNCCQYCNSLFVESEFYIPHGGNPKIVERLYTAQSGPLKSLFPPPKA